jgi:hypothetical protein
MSEGPKIWSAFRENDRGFEKLEKGERGRATTRLQELRSRVSMSAMLDVMAGFGFFYGVAFRQL